MSKRSRSKRKAGFARARVERLIRNAGAFRVSVGAVSRLNETLTDYGMNVSRHAVDIAKHSGRKTVQEADVKLAATR